MCALSGTGGLAHAAPPDADADDPADTDDADASAAPAPTPVPAPVPADDEATETGAASPSERGADDPIARAFEVPVAARTDPFGPRPADAPKVTRDQLVAYALENPAVDAATAKIEAMEANLLKAKFAWIPTIKTNFWLSPGANVDCDDVYFAQTTEDGTAVVDASGNAVTQTFQYCRPGGNENLDIQEVGDYLKQLGEAGIFMRFEADFVVPLYTFGKIRNAKKLAEIGVALTELERQATRQQLVLKVYQAHAALLLARESLSILDEAYKVLEKERGTIEKELGGGPDAFDADPADMNPDRDPDDLVRVELAELEMAELAREARKIEATSLAALWALAGEAAPPGFDVVETQLGPEPMAETLKPSTYYKDLAFENRPEALMAEGAVKARRQKEKLARSNFFPDIGFAVRTAVGYANAFEQGPALYYNNRLNYSRFAFGLVMDWKLDFHNDAFNLKKARARTRQAMSERDAARLLLGLEVEKAYQELTDAQDDARLLAVARDKSWSLVLSEQASSSVGAGEFKDMQKALEQWARFEFRRVQAVSAYNVALAKLSRVTGTALSAPVDAAEPAYTTPEPPQGRRRRGGRRRGSGETGPEGPKAAETPSSASNSGASSFQ